MRARKYPSDLTDEQWRLVERLIPVYPGGRPRKTSMRDVLDAIFYVLRTGCQWEFLPKEFPPKSTVWGYYDQWRHNGTLDRIHDTLREKVRRAAGRKRPPSAGSLDSQSVPATEGGAQLKEIEATEFTSVLGRVVIQRLTSPGEVHLHGPGEAPAMEAVLTRLGALSGGMVMVDGGWERRAFASPGVTDGVVLVLAAGYSATPERSAAAARYLVETLSAPPGDESARHVWGETASKGATGVLRVNLRPGVPTLKVSVPVPLAAEALIVGSTPVEGRVEVSSAPLAACCTRSPSCSR